MVILDTNIEIRPTLRVPETLTDDDLGWVNRHLGLAELPQAIRSIADLVPAMPAPPSRRAPANTSRIPPLRGVMVMSTQMATNYTPPSGSMDPAAIV